MVYDKQSPEAALGAWAEKFVIDRAHSRNWYVLHTAEIGEGATMVSGPDGRKVVMPDLQLLDLVSGRHTRFVEVKVKRGAYLYQVGKVARTGIDYALWEHYWRINGSGVPVDLALVHLRWPLRHSEIAPKLLWQTVESLAQCGPIHFDSPGFKGGAAVWDVEDFQMLGSLELPPPDILELMKGIKVNLRAWEAAPKLRLPRDVPGQGDLFSGET